MTILPKKKASAAKNTDTEAGGEHGHGQVGTTDDRAGAVLQDNTHLVCQLCVADQSMTQFCIWSYSKTIINFWQLCSARDSFKNKIQN